MFFAFTELNVTLSAIYTPAPGGNHEKLGSNEYLAGSALLLKCTVEGNSSSVMYKWSVMENLQTPDCSEMKCNIDTSSTTSVLTVGSPAILSYYAGDYTCNVSENGRRTATNSNIFTVNVFGKCISFILF